MGLPDPTAPTQQRIADLQASVARLENELAQMAQTRLENERNIAFLKGVLEQSLAGIYVIDGGTFAYVNQTFADIFGYPSPDDIIGKIGVPDLVAPECRDLVLGNVQKRTSEEVHEMRYAFTGLRKDGSRNLVEVHGRAMELNGTRQVIGLLIDLSHLDRANSLAYYDTLTGLPNRALFQDRLEQSIKHAQRSEESFALLFMDLDGFKQINDHRGHLAGDRVLQEFAQRMQCVFRESDTVARLGGDEFVAIMPCPCGDCHHSDECEAVARRALDVLAALAAPIELDGQPAPITASIGISRFPNDGTDLEQLLGHADAAMYRAKKCGRNTYRFALV